MILGNAGFRVRLFLFRARHEDDVHGCTSAVSAGSTETAAHGRSLQGGAPTVGASGDAALDENRCAINRHFQVSWVYINISTKSQLISRFVLGLIIVFPAYTSGCIVMDLSTNNRKVSLPKPIPSSSGPSLRNTRN